MFVCGTSFTNTEQLTVSLSLRRKLSCTMYYKSLGSITFVCILGEAPGKEVSN